MAKWCQCGPSDRPEAKHVYALEDAAGIFCGYVCEDCEAKVREKFNPRIFTDWYDPDQSDVHWPHDD